MNLPPNLGFHQETLLSSQIQDGKKAWLRKRTAERGTLTAARKCPEAALNEASRSQPWRKLISYWSYKHFLANDNDTLTCISHKQEEAWTPGAGKARVRSKGRKPNKNKKRL